VVVSPTLAGTIRLMSDITTPKQITEPILTLCGMIEGSELPPIYVPVKPLSGAPVNECIHIVRAKVAKDGGSILNGWIIWEWPFTYLEAEFHAIWVSTSGEKICVSPKPDGEKSILFIPDPHRPFPDGNRVRSVNLALRDHPLIAEFMELSARKREFTPPPGEALRFSRSHPVAAIMKRMSEIGPQLQAMANVRKMNQWRKGDSKRTRR
jgi:hypothetical protein